MLEIHVVFFCDSAIMSGEEWGFEARGEGETGIILVLKLSVC